MTVLLSFYWSQGNRVVYGVVGTRETRYTTLRFGPAVSTTLGFATSFAASWHPVILVVVFFLSWVGG